MLFLHHLSKRKILTAGILLSTTNLAQAALQPVGPEYLVNTTSSGYEATPLIANSSDNNTLIVWTSEAAYAESGSSIMGQFYNQYGEAEGAEKTLVGLSANIARISEQDNYAHIAMTSWPDGRFALAWSTEGDALNEFESEYDMVLQFFNADGTADGDVITVADTSDREAMPSLASNNTGLIIAWQSYPTSDTKELKVNTLKYRRYSKNGNSLTAAPIIVNSTASNLGNQPSAALSEDNIALITWATNAQGKAVEGSSPDYRVNAALFATNDNPINSSITLDAMDGADTPSEVHAITLNNTDFLAAWDSGIDGSRNPRARTISATGNQGELIESQTSGDDVISGVTKDQDGNAFVAWNRSEYGERTLYTQHVTINGAVGSPVQVSTYTDPEENNAALLVDSDGVLTIAWESWITNDDDAPDIYARRFNVTNQPPATKEEGGSSGGGGAPATILLGILATLVFRRKQ
ncbi:hypothetical protein Y5S_01277 [Alcanivorax nanhaiticus]|uniref:Uncharacterized protein n=1 Tax=Alcanivorax nanhaiticus TaxID=1177154 RepID=A0A095SM01_9GAMM|nr:hypothetical protein [Alcanivorax nanhaiticus]KGD65384.1 hypothetical protein Y5S_01277 [Alcanivorax nanhaiticus]